MDIEPKVESERRAAVSFSERLRARVVGLVTRRSSDEVRARDLVPAMSSYLDGKLASEKLAVIQSGLSERHLSGVHSVTRFIHQNASI